MIFGIGCDIAKVSRFEKWVRNHEMISRFFNSCEVVDLKENSVSAENLIDKKMQFLCEHYAARFAAKEAFAKALGTGFVGLELCDFGIIKDKNGRPSFSFGEKTSSLIERICGKGAKVFVSISHEKEYAVSYVLIETCTGV